MIPSVAPLHGGAEVARRLPGEPIAGIDGGDRLRDLARGGEQQRERQVGGRVGEHVRRVADSDPPRGGGVDVDVVVADRVVGDRDELRARVDEGGVDPVGEQAQDPGGLLGVLAQLRRRWRQTLRPHLDVVLGAQAVESRARAAGE